MYILNTKQNTISVVVVSRNAHGDIVGVSGADFEKDNDPTSELKEPYKELTEAEFNKLMSEIEDPDLASALKVLAEFRFVREDKTNNGKR